MDSDLLKNVKCVLKSLIISNPRGMTLESLCRDYKKFEGTDIPYRQLGFSQLESFLKCMPDVVRIYGCGPKAHVAAIASDKNKHIESMVAAQKKTKIPRRAPPSPPKRHWSPASPFIPSTPFQLPMMSVQPWNSHPSQMGYMAHPHQHQWNIPYQGYPVNQMQYRPQQRRPQENHPPIPKPINQIEPMRREQASNKPYSSEKTLIHTTDVQKPNNLVTRTATFRKAEAVCRDQASNEPPSTESRFRTQKNSEDVHKPNSLISRTRTIKKVEPVGYKITPYEYKCSRNKPKEDHISTSTVRSKPQTNEEKTFKVNDKTGEIICGSKVIPNAGCKQEALPAIFGHDDIFKLDYPNGVATFAHKIPTETISASLRKNKMIKIFVTEVNNPFKFWFHVHHDEHELDDLMMNLEDFFENSELNSLDMPEMCMIPGQLCAALFNDLWHRAEILERSQKQPAEKVKVFFLDYGTVSFVPKSDIKYLPLNFTKTSAQAVRGCLSHIRPAGVRWTRSTSFCFLAMVSDLMLYANVSDIDTKNRVVYMALCDTNYEVDVKINQELVKQGLAEFDSNWDNSELSLDKKKHWRTKYPTFDMLEKGEYPCFDEMGQMLSAGLDYEAMEDENLIEELDGDITEVIEKIHKF